jgi:sterol desaturase/sphingolipid hydroxylase (fatty acid hydroxylase superfamily)
MEYVLHRFRGHAPKGNSRFKKEHLTHHARDYFTPTLKKIAMAAPALVLLAGASAWIAGPVLGLTFTTTFTLAYIQYEITHRRIHTHPPTGWYSRLIRRHHLAHHFSDARTNHGVTSPIWDIVFGTRAPLGQLAVPVGRAPHWMVDRDAGVLRPGHRIDYVLRVRRRS